MSNILNFSSELVSHFVQADIMAPDKRFIALQSSKGNGILLSLNSEHQLFATHENIGSQTGWQKNKLIPDHLNELNTKCVAFDAQQNIETGTIGIVMVLNHGQGDHLYLCLGNSDNDLSWLQEPSWKHFEFDAAEDNQDAQNLKMINIFLRETQNGQYVVADLVRDPKISSDNQLIDRYFVDVKKEKGTAWSETDLHIDLESNRYQSCIGRRKKDEIDGLYTIGHVEDSPQFIYQPVVKKGRRHARASRLFLNLENESLMPHAIASTRNSDDTTQLFCIGESNSESDALYYFAPDNQNDLSEGKLVFSHELFRDVSRLFAHSSKLQTVVWGLNRANQVFYTACQSHAFDDPDAWSSPIILQENVEQISPFLNRANDANSFFAVGGQRLTRTVRNEESTIWNPQQINLPIPDSKVNLTPSDAYRSTVRCMDKDNMPLSDYTLLVSSSERKPFFVNNFYYILDRHPIKIKTNQQGVLAIVEVVESLAGARINITDPQNQSKFTIDPVSYAIDKLLDLDSEEKLRNAEIVEEDGSRIKLLPEDVDKETLQALAKTNKQMQKARTGQQLTENGEPFVLTWPGGKPSELLRENSFSIAFGDLYSRIKSGVKFIIHEIQQASSGAWEFLIEIGNKIYRAVADTLVKIAGALEWLYSKAKVALQKLMKFVKKLTHISKGVDAYVFTTDNTSVKVTIGSVSKTLANRDTFKNEIRATDYLKGTKNHVSLEAHGHKLSGFVDPFTGLLFSNDFGHLLKMHSIIKDDYIVNYGFYDAGPGYLTLTNRNQVYVHVGKNHSNWMGRLIEEYNNYGEKSTKEILIKDLVLSGSHDAGMYVDLPKDEDLFVRGIILGIGGITALAAGVIPLVGALITPLIAIVTCAGALTISAQRITRNLGVTQKENITNQLANGVRYFDIRPGYNILDNAPQTWKIIEDIFPKVGKDFLEHGLKKIKKDLIDAMNEISYSDRPVTHLHHILPGARLKDMISEMIEFLHKNPNEIVVISIVSSGIAQGLEYEIKDKDGKVIQEVNLKKKFVAPPKVIDDIITKQLKYGIKRLNIISDNSIGNEISQDFESWLEFSHEKISDLIENDTRLIVGYDIESSRYSSYSDDPYATADPNILKVELQKVIDMTESDANKDSLPNISMLSGQGTVNSRAANNMAKHYVQAIMALTSFSNAGAWLMSTKPEIDHELYKWFSDTLIEKGEGKGTIIYANDYVDPTMGSLTFDATMKRLKSK